MFDQQEGQYIGHQNCQQECYGIPLLTELLSMKDLKVLHQNISGLLGEKDNINNFFCDFKNNVINIFICQWRSSGAYWRFHIYLKTKTGNGGGVGAYNYVSPNLPFHRRIDLELNGIECIWLEILFPETKSFLIGIIIDLQTLQITLQQILIANLSQCFQPCLRKTKNACC